MTTPVGSESLAPLPSPPGVARELETSRTQVQRLLENYGLVAATFRRR